MSASDKLLDTIISTTPVYSYSPVVLPVPDRPIDLQLRVTAPATGRNLPILLLSSGQGRSNNLNSLNGYAPLAHIWAAQGFAVIQPTHLSAGALTHIPAVSENPGAPFFYRSRAEDIHHILDQFDLIEETVPGLAGRLDLDSIAIAGHSLGGFTAEMLLGRTVIDPDSGESVNLTDPRITQGVIMAGAGRGDDGILNGRMAPAVAFFDGADFSTMTTPALIVYGDKDVPAHFTDQMGPEWYADVYRLAPAPKTLLTVFGAEHIFGGISGYDAAETTDENPARVAAVALLTAAYLRSQFHPEDDSWQGAQEALTTGPEAMGSVESR